MDTTIVSRTVEQRERVSEKRKEMEEKKSKFQRDRERSIRRLSTATDVNEELKEKKKTHTHTLFLSSKIGREKRGDERRAAQRIQLHEQ